MRQGSVNVALVMDHPAQQFARALELFAIQPGIQLNVYYWSVAERFFDAGFERSVSWDIDLLGGYSWAAPPTERSIASSLNWIVHQLRRSRPDVVICYGWASPIVRAAIAYCALSQTRLLLYGDTTWQHSSQGRHLLLRSLLIRALIRLSDGALSTGAFNREFYIRYGMDPRHIWPGVCPADTESFGHARNGVQRDTGRGKSRNCALDSQVSLPAGRVLMNYSGHARSCLAIRHGR